MRLIPEWGGQMFACKAGKWVHWFISIVHSLWDVQWLHWSFLSIVFTSIVIKRLCWFLRPFNYVVFAAQAHANFWLQLCMLVNYIMHILNARIRRHSAGKSLRVLLPLSCSNFNTLTWVTSLMAQRQTHRWMENRLCWERVWIYGISILFW